ncbi:S8 family serine peptidase [Pusillimonas sp. CC-YST705]|uniref:S8 family serine peptidase n=1 Tax=Mesopusillimonas faecipullorum TaxID=2755040 RepID=A0ABS8C8N3_9BURK|nr:S8 family serine peptidase [Mesopusillimonas faecipullorum]MCB5362381.1 S8 family serine peptidase [Mesopusillimonas faecipullorum]
MYTFQWALNYQDSYFKDYPEVFSGGMDLNVEPVHRQGIKGQGVNVLVVDSGVDLHTEDLAPNADFSLSWNLGSNTQDPYPTNPASSSAPHGTAVAGIIAAAQNGKGVMGIAPRVNVGGVNYLEHQGIANWAAAMGGAPWSSSADVINASLGYSGAPFSYDSEDDSFTPVMRALKKLRGGKGAIYLKAAGNDFDGIECGLDEAYYDCSNPGNDEIGSKEPNTIVVAAVNAFGQSSSYSSVGSVNWISGLGGEFGNGGTYGEVATSYYSGPTIFSTDIQGCTLGYSTKSSKRTAFLRGESKRNGVPDNPDCDYAYMNGTSAATPTIAGVVALMLTANPDLGWRDVRDILRISARKVDAGYEQESPHWQGLIPYGARMDLVTNELLEELGGKDDIRPGSKVFPIDLGWQKNGAGYEHSNWYGFGLPDAARAVELAQEYKRDPALSRLDDVKIPEFQDISTWYQGDSYAEDIEEEGISNALARDFPYREITLLGTLNMAEQTVDTVQVRLSGDNVCLGSVGIAVQSPLGTMSLLKLPNDIFRSQEILAFEDYGMSSVAFYGEAAAGNWNVYLVAANPELALSYGQKNDATGETEEVISPNCFGGAAAPADYLLHAQARIIAQ